MKRREGKGRRSCQGNPVTGWEESVMRVCRMKAVLRRSTFEGQECVRLKGEMLVMQTLNPLCLYLILRCCVPPVPQVP